MSHFINHEEFSEDFISCANYVNDFFSAKGRDVIKFIHFASFPTPIHTSFRIGNQLFFVHIVDVDKNIETPGTIEHFIDISERFQCVACLLPVSKTINSWNIENLDWGLIDAKTRKPVNPYSIVSNKKIVMSDNEIYAMGHEYIRTNIITKDHECQVTGFIIDPEVYPSIFFNYKNNECCVLIKVSHGAFPYFKKLDFKDQLEKMKSMFNNKTIYFAGAHLLGEEQLKQNNKSLPFYRGQGYHPKFLGLENVYN